MAELSCQTRVYGGCSLLLRVLPSLNGFALMAKSGFAATLGQKFGGRKLTELFRPRSSPNFTLMLNRLGAPYHDSCLLKVKFMHTFRPIAESWRKLGSHIAVTVIRLYIECG